jgi:hypothetical protein
MTPTSTRTTTRLFNAVKDLALRLVFPVTPVANYEDPSAPALEEVKVAQDLSGPPQEPPHVLDVR